MGVTSVIPDMNPAKPAQVKAKNLVEHILKYKITTACGSPAIWSNLANYCAKKEIKLPSLRAIIMFGAPVPNKLIENCLLFMSTTADVYTPYGATECLPVSNISGREILAHTADKTRSGKGFCVGKLVANTELRIVKESTNELSIQDISKPLKVGSIGEIIVRGKQASSLYFSNARATKNAKIIDENNSFWHRMGDLGYIDVDGKLWFCGRQVHKVHLSDENLLYPVSVEALFNDHPQIRRTALIPLTNKGYAALVVERSDTKTRLSTAEKLQFRCELMEICRQNKLEKKIASFFLHSSFPVDRRHNIKIDRLSLAKFYADKQCDAL